MARSRHVGLLRGVNVAGRNRLAMSDLCGLFEAAGARDVTTHIQSGNVVFSVEKARAAGLAQKVAGALSRDHGIHSAVVLRTAQQFEKVARKHPLAEPGDPEKLLMVGFFLERPTAARVTRLDPDRSPPDSFLVKGQEIYLRYPKGSARSKLSVDYLDRTLETTCTVRNWRTVHKLAELLRAG